MTETNERRVIAMAIPRKKYVHLREPIHVHFPATILEHRADSHPGEPIGISDEAVGLYVRLWVAAEHGLTVADLEERSGYHELIAEGYLTPSGYTVEAPTLDEVGE